MGGSLHIKRVLLIMKTQISQVKEFNSLPCIGRCNTLDLLKSFLSYESQLSGACAYMGVVDGCRKADLFFLDSEIHIWLAGIFDGCDILFINMAGNTPFHSIHTHVIISQVL